MGLARKAPFDGYERNYFVSENTIDRFRDLLREAGHSDAQRVSLDLGNRLDLAVRTEIKQKN